MSKFYERNKTHKINSKQNKSEHKRHLLGNNQNADMVFRFCFALFCFVLFCFVMFCFVFVCLFVLACAWQFTILIQVIACNPNVSEHFFLISIYPYREYKFLLLLLKKCLQVSRKNQIIKKVLHVSNSYLIRPMGGVVFTYRVCGLSLTKMQSRNWACASAASLLRGCPWLRSGCAANCNQCARALIMCASFIHIKCYWKHNVNCNHNVCACT